MRLQIHARPHLTSASLVRFRIPPARAFSLLPEVGIQLIFNIPRSRLRLYADSGSCGLVEDYYLNLQRRTLSPLCRALLAEIAFFLFHLCNVDALSLLATNPLLFILFECSICTAIIILVGLDQTHELYVIRNNRLTAMV
jgi:hypothetical protein